MADRDRNLAERRLRNRFDGDPTGVGLAIALLWLLFELVRIAGRSLVSAVTWPVARNPGPTSRDR